ncbi:MAG: glycosyltransferase family 2 protein [Clostridia bacterium]|nr:glycosyltransferase family 2 protein [Clostridia bacterium]
MNIVLIPAFEPDRQLIKIVNELYQNNFQIIVVNDGSGEEYDKIFDAIKDKADIVKLNKNSGKGAALKMGMRHIKENYTSCENFITCDADGQHRIEDVLKVNEQLDSGKKLVLTIRERKGKIPFRSRFGNDLSKFVYTLLTNSYLSDNQSGLRGFSINNIDWLLNVEKNNYDYEMNVLYYAAKIGLEITTVPIEAIYIENNASSHFSPVKDTIRIYKSLFSLAFGTLLSFVLTEILMLAASIAFDIKYLGFIVSSIGAIGLLIHILLNRFVFLRKITIGDDISTIVFTIIYYFVYTLICKLFYFIFPDVSLFINFNVVYIVCLPLRFFLHQLIFIATTNRNKTL